jgi:hypothetical protein
MSIAIAIFGTPDGFDSYGTGDKELSTSSVLQKFERLGFSRINLTSGAQIWGYLRWQSSSGPIVAVCLLVPAFEHSEARLGGYLGVGVVMRGKVASAVDLHVALQDLLDAAKNSAFEGDSNRFVSGRIRDFRKTTFPQSCKELSKKLSLPVHDNDQAIEAMDGIFLRATAVQGFRLLLADSANFIDCAVIGSEREDFCAAAKQSGFSVVSVEGMSTSIIRAKQAIEQRATSVAASRVRYYEGQSGSQVVDVGARKAQAQNDVSQHLVSDGASRAAERHSIERSSNSTAGATEGRTFSTPSPNRESLTPHSWYAYLVSWRDRVLDNAVYIALFIIGGVGFLSFIGYRSATDNVDAKSTAMQVLDSRIKSSESSTRALEMQVRSLDAKIIDLQTELAQLRVPKPSPIAPATSNSASKPAAKTVPAEANAAKKKQRNQAKKPLSPARNSRTATPRRPLK